MQDANDASHWQKSRSRTGAISAADGVSVTVNEVTHGPRSQLLSTRRREPDAGEKERMARLASATGQLRCKHRKGSPRAVTSKPGGFGVGQHRVGQTSRSGAGCSAPRSSTGRTSQTRTSRHARGRTARVSTRGTKTAATRSEAICRVFARTPSFRNTAAGARGQAQGKTFHG